MTTRPTLAASNYSNSAPLIWSFWKGAKRAEVEYLPDAAPAKCAEMLVKGEVEIALTPVIEYQRIKDSLIVPGVCVGARNAVRSVRLITRGGDLKKAKTVALDVSSRTSVALAQIIFREFFSAAPEFIAHKPDAAAMLEKADAALMIGDPALRLDEKLFRTIDIAELWREFTGCGFVFAFWLVTKNAAERARMIDFEAARDEGLAKVNEIIEYYSPNVPLSRAEFQRYLLENISYNLDEELLAGLKLYYRLARKHNLIAQNRPPEFLS